jgi:hypothetical protein
MKTETNKRTVSSAPTCWQREAPCACLRIEKSPRESHLFPYQHLVTASLSYGEQEETLRLTFSLHDVEIKGRNLRSLLLALQDFAVKWIRPIPERYHVLESGENGVVSSILIHEANSSM